MLFRGVSYEYRVPIHACPFVFYNLMETNMFPYYIGLHPRCHLSLPSGENAVRALKEVRCTRGEHTVEPR